MKSISRSASVVNSASACLRWLDAQKLEEARRSASRAMAEGHRASEIIGRIRALAKKAPPQKDWLDVNETIHEVIALARSEMQRNGVALETELSEHVPLILADRIQLQQVILNLMMNAIEAMSGVGEGPRELLVRSGTDESRAGSDLSAGFGYRGLIRRVSTISSMPSIRPSLKAWAWGWRSAARLSRPTAGGCGRQQMRHAAPSFSSRCQLVARRSHDGTGQTGIRR